MQSLETTSKSQISLYLVPCQGISHLTLCFFYHYHFCIIFIENIDNLLKLYFYITVNLVLIVFFVHFFFMLAGCCTCFSRTPQVWNYELSALSFWAALPWVQKTTSSPCWTVRSYRHFFKVGFHHIYIYIFCMHIAVSQYNAILFCACRSSLP